MSKMHHAHLQSFHVFAQFPLPAMLSCPSLSILKVQLEYQLECEDVLPTPSSPARVLVQTSQSSYLASYFYPPDSPRGHRPPLTAPPHRKSARPHSEASCMLDEWMNEKKSKGRWFQLLNKLLENFSKIRRHFKQNEASCHWNFSGREMRAELQDRRSTYQVRSQLSVLQCPLNYKPCVLLGPTVFLTAVAQAP